MIVSLQRLEIFDLKKMINILHKDLFQSNTGMSHFSTNKTSSTLVPLQCEAASLVFPFFHFSPSVPSLFHNLSFSCQTLYTMLCSVSSVLYTCVYIIVFVCVHVYVCAHVKLGQERLSFSHSPDTNSGFCAAGRSNSLAYL